MNDSMFWKYEGLLSGEGDIHDLHPILADIHKRLQRIEGDRVTHPDGKEFVRVDDHWMPESSD